MTAYDRFQESRTTIMSSTTPEYLTVSEAADLLRVSVSTIRRWIRAGTISAHRAGQRRLLLERADVTSAMRTVAPTENGRTRGAQSPAPWPDRDASRHRMAAERDQEMSARNVSNVAPEQIQAGAKSSKIMAPETWEVIREERELHTEQIMNEIDPEFDQFDLGEVAHMIVHSPDRPRRRLLTEDEQRRWLAALERAQRMSDRIQERSGVDVFPPSEDIIAEMRDERTRQLTGNADASEVLEG
jgi:excisionase family DNA binding protein